MHCVLTARLPHLVWVGAVVLVGAAAVLGNGGPNGALAYNRDMSRLRATYPHLVGSRLDTCLVCHPAGSWQLNRYGEDYAAAGEDFLAIEALDSDGDGVGNGDELRALTFPGDPADYPTAVASATVTATPTDEPTVMATQTPLPTPEAIAAAVLLPVAYRP